MRQNEFEDEKCGRSFNKIMFWMSNERERAEKQFKLPKKKESPYLGKPFFSLSVIFHVCDFFLLLLAIKLAIRTSYMKDFICSPHKYD